MRLALVRPLFAFVTTVVLGVVGGSALGGCDIFGEKNRYYTYCDNTGCYTCTSQGCSPNGFSPTPGRQCRASNDCSKGCYCDSQKGTCVEAGFCDKNADCSEGMKCDVARNSCTPTVGANVTPDAGNVVNEIDAGTPPAADASATGPDLSPVAGNDGGGTPACKADCDCGAGMVCTNGACVAAPHDNSMMCVFNNECGTGQCENSMCQKKCAVDADCGTGDSCQSGFCATNAAPVRACVYNVDCGANKTCINATCHADCQTDADCSNKADFCDHNICQPDWRKVPQCKANVDCAAGLECVNAVCRTHCWTNADCGACVGMPICSMGYCLSPIEANPGCKMKSDCAAAMNCINASCL